MGITIHYSGRARSHDDLSQILDIATRFAAEREWMFAIFEDPLGEYEDFDPESPDFKEREGPYRGIVIRPHKNCEPVRLTFTPQHELTAFTKTQFAPFDIHADIVKLLRAIEPHMAEFTVIDESGFWESGDEAAARKAFAELDAVLDAMDEELKRGIPLEIDYSNLMGEDDDGNLADDQHD